MGNLTPGPSFGHNLYFKYPNGSWEPIFNIYVSRAFLCHKELFNPMNFNPYNCLLKIWESIGNSQSGNPLKSVWVHSFTLSYTLQSMKCDTRASFLACTFASSCFDRKPKVKVVTSIVPRTFTMILDGEVIMEKSLSSTLSSLSIENVVHLVVK